MGMQLEDFIKKYGEVSGTKRFLGSQRAEATKKEKYKAQPYARLSREWYIWRYGEVEGIKKFETFASKSAHTLDNFILRYGEVEGTIKYNETVSKKNTVKIRRETLGETADEIIKEQYRLSVVKRAETEKSKTEDEKKTALQKRRVKTRETRRKNGTDGKKLTIFIKKYGEIEGPKKYAEYLCTIFKSIGSSKPAETLIKNIIENNTWLTQYSLYYRDSDTKKSEWFISDTTGVNFYDFVVREAKTILEYDGHRWHPTEEQAKLYGDELMSITGISYKQKYEADQKKIKKANDNGFTVFVVRSDMSASTQNEIINTFLSFTKEKLCIQQ